jgi:hypothetical protein
MLSSFVYAHNFPPIACTRQWFHRSGFVAVAVSGLSSYVPLSWRCARVGGSFSWFDKEISSCYQGFFITGFALVNRACSWLYCIIRTILSKKSWLGFSLSLGFS